MPISITTPGGGSAASGGTTLQHVIGEVPTPATDGTVVSFTLAYAATPGSVSVYQRFSGTNGYLRLRGGGGQQFSENSYGSDVTTSETAITNSATFGAAANAIDDNNGTYWGSGVRMNVGASYIGVDLGSGDSKHVRRTTIKWNTSGGFSIPTAACAFQWSDDNSAWTTVTSFTPAGNTNVQTHDIASSGAHRYWRVSIPQIAGLFEPAVSELTMHELLSSAGGVTLATAPASGDALLVDYIKA